MLPLFVMVEYPPMAEKITGQIFLLNEDGDADRPIYVDRGGSATIAGTFGALIIDMVANPPKVQGKGNVWVEVGGALIRTTRMNVGDNLSVFMSADGVTRNSIGSIACS
jgi:hypothetical protein